MVAVTREVARYTVASRFEDLPDSFMKLRNVGKMNILNDAAHSRSLFESIMMPELISVLRDWTEDAGLGVLIGTAAFMSALG